MSMIFKWFLKSIVKLISNPYAWLALPVIVPPVVWYYSAVWAYYLSGKKKLKQARKVLDSGRVVQAKIMVSRVIANNEESYDLAREAMEVYETIGGPEEIQVLGELQTRLAAMEAAVGKDVFAIREAREAYRASAKQLAKLAKPPRRRRPINPRPAKGLEVPADTEV